MPISYTLETKTTSKGINSITIKGINQMLARKSVLFLVILACCICFSNITGAQKLSSSENELREKAEHSFKTKDYAASAAHYAQLLSLYPDHTDFNYRYGVSLLLSGNNKAQAISYLETASKNPKINPDVHFYLGRAFSYANNYDAAVNAFNTFIQVAGAAKAEKYSAASYLASSKLAWEYSKTQKDVSVINNQQVNRTGFYAVYDFDNSGGKVVSVPELIRSSVDKDKYRDQAMYISENSRELFFASYGKNEKTGKDIYRVTKTASGEWGQPVNVGSTINTAADEEFPFLDKDGRTLYFASKGHAGIGGYDIFRSVYDAGSGQWTTPENIGLPVNSPDDDILYVQGDGFATYATNLESENGRIEIRKISIRTHAAPLANIKGAFMSQDQSILKDARITILNKENNGVVTSVTTDPRTGTYNLSLTPGREYTLIVEANGYVAHAENFAVSQSPVSGNYKQEVKLNRTHELEVMTLSNSFTPDQVATTQTTSIPDQVVYNQYWYSDSSKAKLQTLNVDGRNIAVTQPTSTDEELDATETEEAAVTDNTNITTTTNSSEQKNTALAVSSTPTPGSTEAVQDNTTVNLSSRDEGEAVMNKISNSELPLPSFGMFTADQVIEAEQKAQISKEQAATYDSLAKSQLRDARALILTGDQEKMWEAKAIFKQSMANAKLADSTSAVATNLTADAKQMRAQVKANNQSTQTVVVNATATEAMPATATLTAETKTEQHLQATVTPTNEAIAVNTSVAEAKPFTSENANTNTAQSTEPTVSIPLDEVTANNVSATEPATQTEPVAVTPNVATPTGPVQQNAAVSELTANQTVTPLTENTAAVAHPTNAAIAENVQPVHNPVTEQKLTVSNTTSPVTANEQETPVTEAAAVNTQQTITTEVNEAEISQAIEQLTPEVKTEVTAYREAMKTSVQLTADANRLQQQVISMPVSDERTAMIEKANDLNRQSIVKWQEAQKNLATAKSADESLTEKLPASAFVFDATTTTSAERLQLAAVQPAKTYTVNTSSALYPHYHQNNMQIEEKKQETIKNFAASLDWGKQAEEKRTKETEYRTLANSAATEQDKSILLEQATQYQREADSLDIKSKQSLILARNSREDVKMLTADNERLLVQMNNPVAANTSFSETTGFAVVVPGKKETPGSVTETIASVNTVSTASEKATSVKPVVVENKEVTSNMSMTNSAEKVSVNSTEPGAEITRKVASVTTNTKTNNSLETITPFTEAILTKENVFNKSTSQVSKPDISMNPSLPDGLIFKVQVGAFKTPVAASRFKGVEPVNGETSRKGWIRYCVGLFRAYESASAVKSEMRKSGFSDAFVVAYFNGKRIPLFEAYALIKKANEIEVQQYATNRTNEANLLSTLAIQVKPSDAISTSVVASNQSTSPTPSGPLKYAVQVGVFRTNVAPGSIASFESLRVESSTKKGLYRFTSGNYTDISDAETAKAKIISSGIKDAFIVAYSGDTRIAGSQLKAIRDAQNNTESQPTANAPKVQAAKPVANLTYKVQLGAYHETVPVDMVNTLVSISNTGISQETDSNGLKIFYAGNFTSESEALHLKNEVIAKGLKDAFVATFSNGKKIQTAQTAEAGE